MTNPWDDPMRAAYIVAIPTPADVTAAEAAVVWAPPRIPGGHSLARPAVPPPSTVRPPVRPPNWGRTSGRDGTAGKRDRSSLVSGDRPKVLFGYADGVGREFVLQSIDPAFRGGGAAGPCRMGSQAGVAPDVSQGSLCCQERRTRCGCCGWPSLRPARWRRPAAATAAAQAAFPAATPSTCGPCVPGCGCPASRCQLEAPKSFRAPLWIQVCGRVSCAVE